MDVDRASLVGAWRLAAASSYDPDGTPAEPPFGPSPAGLLIYTSDGHMAALISHSGRQRLSTPDRQAAGSDERAAAFATSFAYGGRYTVGTGEVRHHVEVASIENWVGTVLVRTARFDDGRLVLRTPPTRVAGAARVVELVWERD